VGGGKGRFFRGVLEKLVFLRGVFVVSCGGLRGKSWLVDGRFCGVKKMPDF
jgi:hypothetical protein